MRRLGTALAPACLAAGLALLAPAAVAAPGDGAGKPPRGGLTLEQTVVDPDQSFRGLDAVDRRTAWVAGGSVSGGAGSVHRTSDGGRTWVDVTPPGVEGLQLRDVEVTGRRSAVALSIGEGEASRVFRTTDDGRTWSETFRNTEPTAFYNCVDFFPGGEVGLAVSDPVDGRFRIIRTTDGGASWRVLPDAGMPDSTGEANFAASGDCLVTHGREASFGTGGDRSRVFTSRDRGLTWTATDSAIPAGEAAGVFGLVFRGAHGVAVGGDFSEPTDGVDATSTSSPPRRGWTSGGDLTHLAEDAAFVRGRTLLATGESGDVAGTSLSTDGGRSWRFLTDVGFHTLDCAGDACWAAGGGGRVARVTAR
ncbi:oxidoreductase [Nocardioides sp. CFH 31398]|uniref:WD40/YVTN/BNR-like repeat-containing protein n=1 Tax=Nocardioides sp. CFH 31398 TaxID=2919579 RepID=UPI001F05232D|nr:oxidoreductase [Nocardioides sp. CFH 31398]MCH1866323.1 oxidoreductase [Nocardioides sp. CFH 31398]